jgi:arylsulfatase
MIYNGEIMKTSRLLISTVAVGVLAGCQAPKTITGKGEQRRGMNRKPNILFIMTDQHRFDALGCMGNKVVKTPNLNMLAKGGVVFDAAYTPCPVCAPARAAIFSGQYPNGCGVNGNWVPFSGNEILMTDQLKTAGYTTGGVGKLHFVPHVRSWGFDFKQLHDAPYSIYADDDKYSAYIDSLARIYGRKKADEFVKMFDEDEQSYSSNLEQFIVGRDFIPEKHHMVTWTAEQSIRFLKERDQSKPFFLYTGFFGPHQPWGIPKKWDTYNPADIKIPELDDKYDDKPIISQKKTKAIKHNREIFSKEDYQRIIAKYYGQVTMIDHYIGQIFDELKAQGLWDNTIIVFTADHGDHNGQFGLFFKCTMLESSARVPLLIKPAGKTEMKRVDVPVSTVDLYGTILEAAGAKHWEYDFIESGSLNTLIDGGKSAGATPCYSILGPQSMLRKGNYKLVRLEQPNNEAALYELYFLCDNRLDGKNIYGDSSVKDIQAELQKQLDDWTNAQQSPKPVSWRRKK